MKVLVINTGSSSIKYEVFDMSVPVSLATGILEQIGESEGRLRHGVRNASGEVAEKTVLAPVSDHREGMRLIGERLSDSGVVQDTSELYGIGHRVVHGGEVFKAPTLIDPHVLATIRAQIPLAPLHNPANLVGIEVALTHCPDVPQVAVFDTAFHQTIPPHAFHYAIPRELYEKYQVRRYGFHGSSHCYVAGQAAVYLEHPLESLNLIVLHLGNGASAAAIRGGHGIDTSMGLTPLEGLIMGTRSGDIDPALVFYIAREAGRSIDEIDALLNRESGLRGICGANDMREILNLAEEGDGRARLAIDMYTYRIKKYVGAYLAALGRVDAIVFTGGIGENATGIRARALSDLASLGIEIDPERNRDTSKCTREIQTEGGQVKVLVIPTDEELQIARETVETIQA